MPEKAIHSGDELFSQMTIARLAEVVDGSVDGTYGHGPLIQGGEEAQERADRMANTPFLEQLVELQRIAKVAQTALEGAKIEELSAESDPLSSLKQRRLEAVDAADFTELEKIIEEVRSYDGWDETDPRFAHLIDQCSDDIRKIMTYYG